MKKILSLLVVFVFALSAAVGLYAKDAKKIKEVTVTFTLNEQQLKDLKAGKLDYVLSIVKSELNKKGLDIDDVFALEAPDATKVPVKTSTMKIIYDGTKAYFVF